MFYVFSCQNTECAIYVAWIGAKKHEDFLRSTESEFFFYFIYILYIYIFLFLNF